MKFGNKEISINFRQLIVNFLEKGKWGFSKTFIPSCQNNVFAENCSVLGHYATSSGNFLPTFRDNLSVPSSGFFFDS